MAFPPLSPPCAVAAPGPPACGWQRLSWSEAGTGGVLSAGLATVFASEIQIANICALFAEGIFYIYRTTEIHDLEGSWSKIWIIIAVELL